MATRSGWLRDADDNYFIPNTYTNNVFDSNNKSLTEILKDTSSGITTGGVASSSIPNQPGTELGYNNTANTTTTYYKFSNGTLICAHTIEYYGVMFSMGDAANNLLYTTTSIDLGSWAQKFKTTPYVVASLNPKPGLITAVPGTKYYEFSGLIEAIFDTTAEKVGSMRIIRTDPKPYEIDDDGNILTDESGNPILETDPLSKVAGFRINIIAIGTAADA